MKNEQINPGNFTEQVVWQQPTKATGTMGNITRSFTAYKTDWVEVLPVAINEAEQSNRMQYLETYTFTAHYDSAIRNTWQLTYNGEDYNILKLEPLNLKRFLRATAVKIED